MPEMRKIDAEQLNDWLNSGEAVLVDVRESNEFSDWRIPQAMSMPLTNLESYLPNLEGEKRKIVFQCLSGKRSEMAVESAMKRLGEFADIYNLTGGIEAWTAQGFNTIRVQEGGSLPIIRQVHIAAGSIVVAFSLLGLLGLKFAAFITLLVGCGLTFAGLTGWCGMALLLQYMPWNRKSS